MPDDNEICRECGHDISYDGREYSHLYSGDEEDCACISVKTECWPEWTPMKGRLGNGGLS